MSFFHPVIAELLYAYFAGQTTPLQKQQLEPWLKESAYAEFFYPCRQAWEKKK